MEDQNKKIARDDFYIEPKILSTLNIFTKCFVLKFEEKFSHYCKIASARDEKLSRNLKSPEAITLRTIGKAFRFFGERTWNHSNKKTAINFTKQPFFKNPDKIREILVTAAVCIFACYESQFKNINLERDLEEISTEAVERCFNYYKKKTGKMDSSLTAITKGVIFGKSRDFAFKRSKVKNIYVDSLFDKVGVVTLATDGNPDNYYKKKGGSVKYGYRTLLEWEMENIYRAYLLNVEYQRQKPPRITKYKYSLNSELIKKYSKDILNEINKIN